MKIFIYFFLSDLIENITKSRDDLKFPEDEDLTGAAEALLRLQDTYKLDTSSLARGQISGTKQSHELTGLYIFYYNHIIS